MYIHVPKNPINDREEIAGFIASFLYSTINDESISAIQYEMLYNRLKEADSEQIYNFYITLTRDPNLGSFIKKSVNLSYDGGFFGLSSNSIKKLAYDIRRELHKLL